MGILSIQSAVAAGHVGNSAAVFPLQRMGFEVWRVDTVHFSNHPAHGRHRGRVATSDDIGALLQGLEELGLWPRCEGVITGYLGAAETGPVVARALARIRAARPDVLHLCDPVIGDQGRRYVADGLIDYYRTDGLPAADIATPNAFEATCLTGIDASTVSGALAAAHALRRMGPRIVVVTGVLEGDAVQTVAADAGGAWRIATPHLAVAGYGAGDLFAALLLGHLLRRASLADAAARAVSSTHTVLAAAATQGALDLPLIDAQDTILDPPKLYPAEQLD
jgi:pyridoxine kinase